MGAGEMVLTVTPWYQSSMPSTTSSSSVTLTLTPVALRSFSSLHRYLPITYTHRDTHINNFRGLFFKKKKNSLNSRFYAVCVLPQLNLFQLSCSPETDVRSSQSLWTKLLFHVPLSPHQVSSVSL